MNKTKLLSLLGLSRRAGKLIYGFDSAVESVKSKKAKCLLYAFDISEKTEKNLKYEAEKYGVEIIKLNLSILDAGNAIGKKAGVFALTDEGFTKAVKELNRNIEI